MRQAGKGSVLGLVHFNESGLLVSKTLAEHPNQFLPIIGLAPGRSTSLGMISLTRPPPPSGGTSTRT